MNHTTATVAFHIYLAIAVIIDRLNTDQLNIKEEHNKGSRIQ
jgi:hypothetical protein